MWEASQGVHSSAGTRQLELNFVVIADAEAVPDLDSLRGWAVGCSRPIGGRAPEAALSVEGDVRWVVRRSQWGTTGPGP